MIAALSDDLNTPLALAGMHEILRDLNVALQAGRAEEATDRAAELLAAGALLGVLQQDPEGWLRGRSVSGNFVGQGVMSAKLSMGESEIEALIQRRSDAKRDKNFAEADRIRTQLAEEGIIVEDKPGGVTEWRRG